MIGDLTALRDHIIATLENKLQPFTLNDEVRKAILGIDLSLFAFQDWELQIIDDALDTAATQTLLHGSGRYVDCQRDANEITELRTKVKEIKPTAP